MREETSHPELCEWEPVADQPAVVGGAGCVNVATLNVGAGRNNYHLCRKCAALPRFRRMSKRLLASRTDAAAERSGQNT